MLSANTGPFAKSMTKAGSTVRRFARNAAKAAKIVGAMGVAAGVAAAGGVALLTRQGLKSVDALGKLSDRLGESVENLQALQLAAELNGSSGERLGKALEVMQKRLGEAARGSGAAKAALDELGLSASDLIELGPAEAFRVIADAISRMDTQSQKAAATANIFSRANQDLLNTLQRGRSGLDETQRLIEKLGLNLNRVDAKRVENANDAITRLGAILEGVRQRLAVAFAPIIEVIAQRIEALGNRAGGIGGIMQDAFLLAAEAGVALDTVVASINAGIKQMEGNAYRAQGALLRLAGEATNALSGGSPLGTILNAAGAVRTGAGTQTTRQASDIFTRQGFFEKLINEIRAKASAPVIFGPGDGGGQDLLDAINSAAAEAVAQEVDAPAAAASFQLGRQFDTRNLDIGGLNLGRQSAQPQNVSIKDSKQIDRTNNLLERMLDVIGSTGGGIFV